MTLRTLPTAALLAAFLFLGAAATAQTAPDAARLAERLNVSEATAAAVHSALVGAERQPGFLWGVAADLATELTAEQRAELIAGAAAARGERRSAVRQRGEGARGERRQGAGLSRAAAPMMRGVRSLTDEQRAELRAIAERHRPAMRELAEMRREGGADRAQLLERGRELRTAMRADMEAVLTAEQRAQLADGARQMRQRGTADARAQQQAAREAALNLTAEQRATMEERRATMRQQQGARDGERRQAMRQRGGEAQRDAILTEQQREVAQIHRALMRAMGPAGGSR
jgi:Spy/CpxP family protein refolding chaperone